MPLRAFWYSLLLVAAVAPNPARADLADWMGWMTREQMMELPEALRKPIPEWCPGIYYNPRLAREPEEGDAVVTADRTRFDQAGLAELIGDVEIELPGTRLRADSARLDQDSGEFELEGEVQARGRDFGVIAGQMRGNLDAREAFFSDVRYSLHDQQARGSAGEIHYGPIESIIRRGSYTTCAPGQRGWELSAGEIRLNREKGWGEARNVVLRVRDVPALYLPWITFPIDDRRKSGLLFPTLGSADEGGLDITQPLYLNLHPQLDATIAPRHIQNRGSGLENELRYLTLAGEGVLNYAWLHADRRFDNEDRELASWRHEGQLGAWQLESDVNYVSDDFYFEDLDTGLDVRAVTHLPRLGQARYRGDVWDFRVRLQAWQTLDPELEGEDLPFRRVPQLHLRGQPGLPGPARLLWESDLTRFERGGVDPAEEVQGQRLHLQPALTLPVRRSWGYVEPRVRVYDTRYDLDGTGTDESSPERTLAGASLDAGLFLERSLFGEDSGLMQTLEPRLFYNYIEFEDQSELPEFDSGEITLAWTSLFRENRFTGYDRIGDEDRFTLGLTSRILRPEAGGERLRLRTGQSWHRRDRKVQLRDLEPETTSRSPLITDITWFPRRHWHLFAENQWDSEESRTRRNTLRAGYSPGPRRALHLGYHRRHIDNIDQGELAAAWPVHANWSLLGRWLYDLEHHRSVEALAGIEYRDCCWQIRLVGLRELFRREENGTTMVEAENRYFLQIRLQGLGGLGERIDNLLERSIPGLKE